MYEIKNVGLKYVHVYSLKYKPLGKTFQLKIVESDKRHLELYTSWLWALSY